ncbi:M48 family metallopeptidase [uncultured Bacteroides sp.]|uniref:tetratricopeptide repeat protein n=1 Tax=uncultured Bacteroides sp. TaxID=162156 RepID=UPI0025EDD6E9|nr:tetratricopeptide repeat protein [uncultured Bacteroides sp.]
MRNKYILFLLSGLLGMHLSAQTLAQAKAFYAEGRYEQAKPAFKKLVKTQPNNGSYNLWYGVCCLNTGESEEAVKYLETAVKRRATGGQFYLGQAYNATYRFEEAVDTYEDYIAELAKRKRSTTEAEKLLEKSKANLRMLKGVEEVCFIDSFVVDKKDFLKAYKISPESGKLFMYDAYFDNSHNKGGIVYETELGNKVYYSELQPDSMFNILSRNKMMDEWGQGNMLPGNINEPMNANYPYVLADGITIYYAADGDASMGGYDIFVTRYNTNTDTYLTPENVGMPFNSPYNDYMYVIDEFNNLGWFASDRYQPEGKVCIYVFIPTSSKQVYNYESIDRDKLIKLARIHSIKDTWTDEGLVADARKRLQETMQEKPAVKERYEFEFVIDDNRIYHYTTDFRSPQAKVQFKKYLQLKEAYNQQLSKLENMRPQYAHADQNKKSRMAPAILDLEKRVQQLATEIDRAIIQVRKSEKQTLK